MTTSLRLINTTRRLDAEAGVNLSKWRAWFDEPPPADPAPTPNPTPPGVVSNVPPVPPDPETPPDWVSDPAKAYAEIQKVRREAETYRQRAGKAEGDLQQKLTAEQQAEQQKLIDEKKWQTLAEQRETALKKAQTDLEAERLTRLRLQVATDAGLPPGAASRLMGANEAELKADAEALKALIPPVQQQPPPGGTRLPGTTSPRPGGPPASETEAQKRARLFGR